MVPITTPGYHQCPRCASRDIYFAARSAGTIGNIVDLPNGMANPAIGYQMEKKVALCRACGERADWFAEKIEYSEEEKILRKAENFKAQWKVASVMCLFASIWFYFQVQTIGGSPNDQRWYPLIYLAPLSLGVLSAYKGWRK
jgi:hypothetical protein